MNRLFGHLRNIIVHKYWVYQFGSMMGISSWRLLMHDISKFSPIEFWESVKYYQGTSSPIPACKKDKGYSNAWQHHKGHNPHHYEYWTDNYDTGMTLIPMPFECIEEMIADWCAAGITYSGDNWSLKSQREWWENKKEMNPSIHPETIHIIDAFFEISTDDDPFISWMENKHNIKLIYNTKTKQ